MIGTYLVVLIFLVILIIGVSLISAPEVDFDDTEERWFYFGLITLGLVASVLWPLTLALVFPAALCYGLYCIVKMVGVIRKERGGA